MPGDWPSRPGVGRPARPTTSARTSSRSCARCAPRSTGVGARPHDPGRGRLLARRDRRARRPARRATTRTCGSCTGRARRASGRPTWPDSSWRCSRGRGAGRRDGRRFLPRPAYLPRDDRGRARRRPGARLALRAGRRRPQLGAGAALVSRGGCWYARIVLGLRRAGPDRRLQVLPAGGAGGARPRAGSARRATPSRSSSPTARCSSGFRVREVPIVFTDRRVGQSKMSRRIVLEAMWMVPALRGSPCPQARLSRNEVSACLDCRVESCQQIRRSRDRKGASWLVRSPT